MNTPASRDYDRRRAKALPWRRWYKLKAWKLRVAAQRAKVPWCEPCKLLGRSRPMQVANHKTPHRGDPWLFWHGPLESACFDCHNQMIQKAEAQGFRVDAVDDEGWPADPNHPFNRPRRSRRCVTP